MKTTFWCSTGIALLTSQVALAQEIPIIENNSGDFEVRLEPTLHLRAAHGATTIEDGSVAFGGHDPDDDGFNLQGFELGANIFLGENISGFTTVNIFKNNGEDFEAEFEEGFLTLNNLPGGFELRGGRMLARFGDQNAKHLHAWDFVDNSIGNVRYFGEDGFAYEGGELTWISPASASFQSAFSVGVGSAVSAHHEEEEGEESEAEEIAEGARPEDNIVALRYQAKFGPNDFHQLQAGASYITGDNGLNGTTDIYGADLAYTWRENGFEPGGRQFTWRNEWIKRDVDYDDGGFDDSAFTTALIWQFIETWDVGLRYEYVEAAGAIELAERQRLSPSITKHHTFADDLTGIVRLQYNYDDIEGQGNDHSLWLQFGFDWGPAENR